MKKLILLALFGMLSQTNFAQEFDLSLEFKPRFEYRHGYKTLIPDDVDAATFVSQRSRLNFNYGSEKLKAFTSYSASSQTLATETAARAARDRLMVSIADQVSTSIIMNYSTNQ